MTTPIELPDSLKALRILLVDDDDFMLDVVVETMRQLGIENLSRAESGTGALTRIEAAPEPFFPGALEKPIDEALLRLFAR